MSKYRRAHVVTTQRLDRQRGAALIVSLLILTVMTLIGVTAVSSTSVDERIAANSQQKMITFQATESAINQAIVDATPASPTYVEAEDPLRAATNAGPNIVLNNFAQYDMDPEQKLANTELLADVDVVYTGQTIAPGYGFSSGLTMFTFTLDVTTQVESTAVRSHHIQGVRRPAPSL